MIIQRIKTIKDTIFYKQQKNPIFEFVCILWQNQKKNHMHKSLA